MYNPYLTVPIVVWAIAQFTKFVVAAARGQLDYNKLFASGGMPSVHTAVVVSMMTTVYLLDGPQSALFGVVAAFSGIVIYDSLGVRRSNGEQAVALNVVIDSLESNRIPLSKPQANVREILGHKPAEVAVGGIIGLVAGLLLNPSKLGPLINVLTHPIGRTTTVVLTGIAAVLIILGFIARAIYLRRYHDIAPLQRVIKRSYILAASLGFVGLILAFLAWQKVAFALWIIWPVALAVALVAIIITKLLIYKDKIPVWLENRREQAEKDRWLEGPNKKRRAAKARSRKRR